MSQRSLKQTLFFLFSAIACLVCYTPSSLNAAIFEPFIRRATQLATRIGLSQRTTKTTFQTPSSMLPLSRYHCLGIKYSAKDTIDKLEYQLARGIRYFEFDVRTEKQTRYKFWTHDVTVVGANAQKLESVLDTLARDLNQSRYSHEVVIVKLNHATIKNIGTIDFTKKHYLFAFPDTRLPLMADLRRNNKRS